MPDDSNSNRYAGMYQLFMLGLCVYVLLALAADTFFRLDESTSEILEYADTGICIIFLADFFVRLILAKRKLAYLKWGWIDFLSSIPMVNFLRWGRFARVIRILRVLRGVRSMKMLAAFILNRRAEGAFAAASLVSIILLVFGSIAILQCETAEGSNIHTARDALWWSFVTITTVGYGDRYPVTWEGQVVAAILMTAGVGLFGTFTGFIASWFLAPGEKEQEDELEAVRKELTEIKAILAQRA
ncbi:MAG: ion transporter [Phycisphaerae bacterium]|nr:ion transporter [Phycisphaerae bacterium]